MNIIKLLKITVSRKYRWEFNIRVICVYFDSITSVTCIFICIWQVELAWRNTVQLHLILRQIGVKFSGRFLGDIVASKLFRKFICAEFRIFSTYSKHRITILVIISHGNRPLTSYICFQTILILYPCMTQITQANTRMYHIRSSGNHTCEHKGIDLVIPARLKLCISSKQLSWTKSNHYSKS